MGACGGSKSGTEMSEPPTCDKASRRALFVEVLDKMAVAVWEVEGAATFESSQSPTAPSPAAARRRCGNWNHEGFPKVQNGIRLAGERIIAYSVFIGWAAFG
jgi:hypothetical protein